MAKRKVSNPLALAVLGLLCERPMHPYEMSTTLRDAARSEHQAQLRLALLGGRACCSTAHRGPRRGP